MIAVAICTEAPVGVDVEALAKAAGYGLHADFRQICLTGDPFAIVHLPQNFGPVAAWSITRRVVESHLICAAVSTADAVWCWHEW